MRGEGEGAVVAVARTETRAAPVIRTVLEIPGFPPIDFIPNNRPAVVLFPKVSPGELTLLPIEGVYEVNRDGAATTVQGDINAVGLVALRFGYRVPTLPAPLDKVDLGVLSDSLQRSVKEANVPAPFGLSALTPTPLVEVECSEGSAANLKRATPGVTLTLPFSAREACRLVIHRERLSPEYGTQRLSLEIEVNKLDGTPRPEGHVTQTLILRAGSEPRMAWIKGVGAPYDRVRDPPVARGRRGALPRRLGHHHGRARRAVGASSSATGHVRLYATTAIPTGLYRFGNATGSGVLSLSLAVITRLTWLDSEGHEGLLGLEGGHHGLRASPTARRRRSPRSASWPASGSASPSREPGSPTQASINLHAWVEQRISAPTTGVATPTMPTPENASARAVIVGPSISFGNIGTTF